MAAPAGAAIGNPVGMNAGNANTSSTNPGVESPSARTMSPIAMCATATVDTYIRSRTDGLDGLKLFSYSVASDLTFVFPGTCLRRSTPGCDANSMNAHEISYRRSTNLHHGPGNGYRHRRPCLNAPLSLSFAAALGVGLLIGADRERLKEDSRPRLR